MSDPDAGPPRGVGLPVHGHTKPKGRNGRLEKTATRIGALLWRFVHLKRTRPWTAPGATSTSVTKLVKKRPSWPRGPLANARGCGSRKALLVGFKGNRPKGSARAGPAGFCRLRGIARLLAGGPTSANKGDAATPPCLRRGSAATVNGGGKAGPVLEYLDESLLDVGLRRAADQQRTLEGGRLRGPRKTREPSWAALRRQPTARAGGITRTEVLRTTRPTRSGPAFGGRGPQSPHCPGLPRTLLSSTGEDAGGTAGRRAGRRGTSPKDQFTLSPGDRTPSAAGTLGRGQTEDGPTGLTGSPAGDRENTSGRAQFSGHEPRARVPPIRNRKAPPAGRPPRALWSTQSLQPTPVPRRGRSACSRNARESTDEGTPKGAGHATSARPKNCAPAPGSYFTNAPPPQGAGGPTGRIAIGSRGGRIGLPVVRQRGSRPPVRRPVWSRTSSPKGTTRDLKGRQVVPHYLQITTGARTSPRSTHPARPGLDRG